jgi:amino-acid N-acetyltransferase
LPDIQTLGLDASETIAIAAGPAVRSVPQSAKDPIATARKARLQDARNVFDLVNSLSGDGTLLRRSYAEICENIRDFTIAEGDLDADGETEFLGCGALHLYGPHLAEVRSIVVKPDFRGQGAGGVLLKALVEEAEEHQVTTVCLFTRMPEFFDHFGFRVADRTALPDKIYKDCQTCPRLYACDEVAMVRGPLPNIAVLGPRTPQIPELVQINPLAPTGTR